MVFSLILLLLLWQVSASKFNSSADKVTAQVENYINWYYATYQNARGTDAAIILAADPSDADGSTVNTGYLIFRRVEIDTVTGYLFFAAYDIPDYAAALEALALGMSKRRRLLAYLGRNLLQYDGGQDGSGSTPCQYVCRRIPGSNPPRYKCTCI